MFVTKLKKIKSDILVGVKGISNSLYLSNIEVHLTSFSISYTMVYRCFLLSLFAVVNSYTCSVM